MKTAAIILAVTLILGVGLLAAGVYLLAGPGWCLISGAAVAFAVSAYLVRGMRSVAGG